MREEQQSRQKLVTSTDIVSWDRNMHTGTVCMIIPEIPNTDEKYFETVS